MLSRVAENTYWIGRYVERADSVARLLIDASQLQLDAAGPSGGPRPLENVLAILNCRAAFDETATGTTGEAVVRFLALERGSGTSVVDMIGRARENARGAQETLGAEAWSQLNELYLFLTGPRAEARFRAAAVRFCQRVVRGCTLFAAVVDGTLPRTEVFHFLTVGRHLERVDMLARTLNAHCLLAAPAPVEAPQRLHWASLLRTCSAFEAYLRHSRERLDPPGVVRYLLLEADFPRSMSFALGRCLESLRALAGGPPSTAERHLGRLEGELRYLDIDEAFERGISRFLTGVQDACAQAGEEIDKAYFQT